MLPILREIYRNPPEIPHDPPIIDTVLRCLYDLAPEEGRRLILDELRRSETRLRLATLAMLPDRTLPEMDSVLLSNLIAGRYNGTLILRYATGKIVKQVESAYQRRNLELDRQNLPQCTDPLVYYFLKFDPEFGERELRRNLSAVGGYPACYDIGFQFTHLGAWAMSPVLERLAIEFLSSPSVPIKRGAAEVLGKHGSPAAEEPLWHTMEFFRSWWKGREALLKEGPGLEGAQFEYTLCNALAKSDGWVLDHAKLQRLHSLCSGGGCREQTSRWLAEASSPIRIAAFTGFRFEIGQYEAMSVEQLRRKLAQYPGSATFKQAILPNEANIAGQKEAREALEAAVRDTGHTFVR